MDIVLCTDNNYVMPCGITMISVLENNVGKPVTFHVIGMDLSEESRKALSSISSEYSGTSLVFYEIKKELFDSYNFSLYESKYLSIAAYSRLFLEDILPQHISKVLYLDCDIVVSADLSELWNTDVEGYSVAGVPDLFIMSRPELIQKLGYDESFLYLNSGVLLINLKYWREHKLVTVFLGFYKENQEKLSYHDQDIINGTLYNTKLLLPIKFNVIDYYYLSAKKDLFGYEDEVRGAIKNPVVIHYTSRNKPWLRSSLHPMNDEFFLYKSISPWKDVPLTWDSEAFSKKIRYYKRKILYALKLKKTKYIELKKDARTGKYDFK